MNLKNDLYHAGLTIIIFILLMSSCSPEAGYQVKSFFLDGVPNPTDSIKVRVTDSILIVADSLQIDSLKPVEPTLFIHRPYLEKKCFECHDDSRRAQFFTSKQELCFMCHTDFNDKYTSMHGPVASGNCTQCHSPHKSTFKSLLLAEKEFLCFNCHDENKVKGYEIHVSIGEKDCITCHNPHGGGNRFFLQSNACYECHENFEEKYTNVHGPVAAGGMCSQCHESHRSAKPKLLAISGKGLCFSCHNEVHIKSNAAHATYKKQECTDCHSPHGSDQPYILTKTIAQ